MIIYFTLKTNIYCWILFEALSYIDITIHDSPEY